MLLLDPEERTQRTLLRKLRESPVKEVWIDPGKGLDVAEVDDRPAVRPPWIAPSACWPPFARRTRPCP